MAARQRALHDLLPPPGAMGGEPVVPRVRDEAAGQDEAQGKGKGESMNPRRVLNFGAGTQSTLLYVLMCEGKIPPAEVAIFSDVGWEPRAVYEHLDWIESLKLGIPIVRIETGSIRQDALVSKVRGKAMGGQRGVSMPLHVMKVWQPEEAELFRETFLRKPVDREDEWSLFGYSVDEGSLVYLRELSDLKKGLTVTRRGMIRRQCTTDYKIDPIRKWIRKNMLGLEPGRPGPKEPVIEQVFGISFDERNRMRDSTESWSIFSYPLVEMKLRREQVIAMARERFPDRTFPRSACIGCPYHSNAEWRDMRDNRPDEWADAVEFDRAIRNCGGMRGQMFLHRDCVPLDEADLSQADQWDTGMINECEGMCGV